MPVGGSREPLTLAPLTFSSGIKAPANSATRWTTQTQDDPEISSPTRTGPNTSKCESTLAQIADSTDKTKRGEVHHNKNLIFLRESSGDMIRPTKNSTMRFSKLPSLTHSTRSGKVKSSYSLYDLYANITDTSLVFKSSNSKRNISKVSNLGNPRQTLLADIIEHSFVQDERLKKWVQAAYKIRKQHSDLKSALDMEDFLDSTGSVLVTHQETKTKTLESQNSRSDIQRRISMPKPRRRGSVLCVQSENDIPSDINKKTTRTFRWCGLIIKTLVGLLMRMQRTSISKTQQSAYSQFLYILAGARTHAGQQGQGEEGQSLLFDKSWFSRTRAWSKMPVWAQTVMRLTPDEREPQDIHRLKQLLGTMRSFRENMTDEMRTKLCQVVRYIKCDKGRIVVRQGHIGSDFYFIFSGSVLVQSEVYNESTYRTETTVENVLRSGESFGEIALLGDGRRTACVICKEPSELCQIDKATFLEVCPALFSQQLQEKIDFARQFAVFDSWHPESLKQLCFLSQVLDVPYSTVIERNWATAKFAYFVMKGRASMLKTFDVTNVMEKATGSIHAKHGLDRRSKVGQKAKITQFAHVGMLHHGDCTDLSVLSVDPRKDIPEITLVSEGVRLFRVAARVFLRLSPRLVAEEYLRSYKHRKFPSEADLRAHYLEDLNWSEYKKNVVHTHHLEKTGCVMASIPATLKGSSGWARWPGYSVLPRMDKTEGAIRAVATANHIIDDSSTSKERETNQNAPKDTNDRSSKKRKLRRNASRKDTNIFVKST